MICLTRLNGKGFVLNSDLIKFLEETPDTVVTLINGERVVVEEKIDYIVDQVIVHNRRVRIFQCE